MKRPAFQFYPADWRKDAALQSCSLAAQGLWVNAMCIAHECEPYGHLSVNGNPMQPAQLARLVGLSARECTALLVELEAAGVFSRSDDGGIYSRRMVADEKLRQARAEGGKSGAEHGNKGALYGALGGRPKGAKKPPLNPPPSSSSSSSSSASTEKQKPRASRLAAMPEGMNETVWQDFQVTRKAKSSPLTETALVGIGREADKAGLSLEAALRIACERGWQSFKADWLKTPTRNGSTGNKSSDIEARNREAVKEAMRLTSGVGNARN